MTIFEKPYNEWTDQELRVGAAAACERRDAHAAAGRHDLAEVMAGQAAELAEEYANRLALARDVDSSPMKVTVEESPGDDAPSS